MATAGQRGGAHHCKTRYQLGVVYRIAAQQHAPRPHSVAAHRRPLRPQRYTIRSGQMDVLFQISIARLRKPNLRQHFPVLHDDRRHQSSFSRRRRSKIRFQAAAAQRDGARRVRAFLQRLECRSGAIHARGNYPPSAGRHQKNLDFYPASDFRLLDRCARHALACYLGTNANQLGRYRRRLLGQPPFQSRRSYRRATHRRYCQLQPCHLARLLWQIFLLLGSERYPC